MLLYEQVNKLGGVMMRRFKNVRWAAQGITAVLLFGMAFVAGGAEQMMRAPSVSTTVQSIAAPTAVVAPAGNTPPTPGVQMKPTPASQAAKPVPAAKQPIPDPEDPVFRTLPSPAAAVFAPARTKPSGVIQVSPAAACGMNNTPRIGSINGRSSGGIVFQPGDKLDIVGCGFGYQGREGRPAELVGNGQQISLIIDTWNDAHITAHIDAGKTGIPDLDSIKLKVWPYGAPILSDVAHKFRAARETTQIAFPQYGNYNVLSKVLGKVTMVEMGSPGNKSAMVQRNNPMLINDPAIKGTCPHITQTQLVDIFPVDIKKGFEVLGVEYANQPFGGINSGDVQTVIIGNNGGAIWDSEANTVTVTFQGRCDYWKDQGLNNRMSRYGVSLTVRGPRGVNPLRIF